MVKVVLVDEKDKEICLKDKVEAHLHDGILHRAFAIIVLNSKGEVLVTRRAADKMLWPLFWDNTCASHPLQKEGYVEAGERRLVEELGFTCSLEIADCFQYQEKYKDVGSENELCTTLTGEYNGEVRPVPTEIADYKWMSVSDLKTDMAEKPEIYTVWFKIALDRLIEKGKITYKDKK